MTPDSAVPLLFPAPPPPPPQPTLQNVETFGSFLGEEIVANWRRSLERTIQSQGLTGRMGLPPPDQPGSVAQSPPPHTPTQHLDQSDDTGNSIIST